VEPCFSFASVETARESFVTVAREICASGFVGPRLRLGLLFLDLWWKAQICLMGPGGDLLISGRSGVIINLLRLHDQTERGKWGCFRYWVHLRESKHFLAHMSRWRSVCDQYVGIQQQSFLPHDVPPRVGHSVSTERSWLCISSNETSSFVRHLRMDVEGQVPNS